MLLICLWQGEASNLYAIEFYNKDIAVSQDKVSDINKIKIDDKKNIKPINNQIEIKNADVKAINNQDQEQLLSGKNNENILHPSEEKNHHRENKLDKDKPLFGTVPMPTIIDIDKYKPNYKASLSDKDILEATLDNLVKTKTMKADFIQIAPDGSLSNGIFFLNRKKGIRFEFDPPSPLLIVANKSIVYVENKELEITDRYPTKKTPLALFFSDELLLSNFVLLNTRRSEEFYELTLQIKKNEIDNIITIGVSTNAYIISYWFVIDPRGVVTSVILSNIEKNIKISGKKFIKPDSGGLFLKNR